MRLGLLILLWQALCCLSAHVSLRAEAPSANTTALLQQTEGAGRFSLLSKASAPVSPTMQCVMALTIQYFTIYLALQIAKTYNQFSQESDKTKMEHVFKSATNTVAFCPMLAILFIGVRMRATQLNMTPQPWAQRWMFICTWSILGQTILAVLSGILAADPRDVQKGKAGGGGDLLSKVLNVVQQLLMFGLYAGFTMVIFSIFVLEAPAGNPNCPNCASFTPGIAPALQCTINLTVQYFTVYLLLQLVSTYNKLMRKGQMTPLEKTLQDATETLMFCPMMAVLFIGARMRALQLQRDGPQEYAQAAFFLCTYAILIQTLMVLITPYFSGAADAEVNEKGERVGGSGTSGFAYVTTFIRYLCVVALYGGAVIVIWSIIEIETPKHLQAAGQKTLPVSPAMQCVMNLLVQFFFIHLLLILVKTYNDLANNGATNNAQRILEGTLPTMALVPMLCILFIGARLRALELDPINGSPQKWAQTCMFLCTYAVLVQTICSLVQPFFTGELKDPDEEGDLDQPQVQSPMMKYLGIGMTVTKFGAMACIYGGFTAVIVSVLIIQAPPRR